MTKQEITLIKKELKELISSEIEYCENNVSGSGYEFDRGFVSGLKQVRDNFVDKFAETLEELLPENQKRELWRDGGELTYEEIKRQANNEKIKHEELGIFDWLK